MILIDVEKLKADIRQFKGLGSIVAETIVRFIEKQPTVDAVEVVRCKDCKHALEITCSTNLACSKLVNWRAVDPNHFCSYGERKDNG